MEFFGSVYLRFALYFSVLRVHFSKAVLFLQQLESWATEGDATGIPSSKRKQSRLDSHFFINIKMESET